MFYAEMGNLEDAEKYLETVAHAAPQDRGVQNNLERVRKTRQLEQEVDAGHATADTYSDLGDFQILCNWAEAEKCLQKVLKLNPKHPDARQKLERVRTDAGKPRTVSVSLLRPLSAIVTMSGRCHARTNHRRN